MALFRRRRREGDDTVGRRALVTDDLETGEPDAVEPEELLRGLEGLEDLEGLEADADEGPGEVGDDRDQGDVEFSARAETGPFDRSEVDETVGNRFDLGSLWLGAVEGLELRIEMEETDGSVREVRAELDGSSMQVQAFAAPRSAGIWSDIRAEIAEGVRAQGGQADEQSGSLGTELLTRLPAKAPDGRVTFQPMRFVGIDGPRWFLRAVLTGPAAGDEQAAEPFLQVLRSSVVVRGEDARPPREMLTLTLPHQLDAASLDTIPGELNADGEPIPDGELTPDGQPPRLVDLNPFERGPEITEIR